MSVSKISGVRVAGIASAVPDHVHALADESAMFGAEEIRKISDSTGVVRRYISPEGMCTSDLCFSAAERLFEATGWARDSVDVVIFVSQTPDYFLPATACTLQARLGLSKQCAAFDVNLGCSGYVYGIWIAANLVAAGGAKRALLLVGDTCNKKISPQDRSVCLLFGDAGTATFIEKGDADSTMSFVLGTDGTGRDNLVIPAGAFRVPHSASTGIRLEKEGNNLRSDEDLYMNGAEIFTFTLREVPPLIKAVLGESGWSMEEVDSYVFHQANKFMLDFLTKKMKLPKDRVPVVLEKYGNTSSASIPVALTEALSPRLGKEALRLVLAGFGVGYSWAAVALTCGPIAMPELVKVPDCAIQAVSGGVAR